MEAMADQYPINLCMLTILTQVRRNPGSRKSTLYTTPYERSMVDHLLNKDIMSNVHPTRSSSAITLTPIGEELLDALMDVIGIASVSEEVMKEVDWRIERNLGYTRLRMAAAEAARCKKKELEGAIRCQTDPPRNPKEYILRDGVYYHKDDYVRLFGQEPE